MRDIGTHVYTQREIEIMWTESITEFFRIFQSFLFKRFLEQVLAILCQPGSSEFEGFVTVQSAFQIKQNPEILKNRRELARLRLTIYKSLDAVSCSENSLLSAIMATEEHTLGELAAILAASL